MESLPHAWFAMSALAFVLVLKLGPDTGHLAAIDGLTRYNSNRGVPVARWCGLLLSRGHGAVVIAVSIVVGVLAARWAIPRWLDDPGIWISIDFRFLLGCVSLRAAIAAPSHEVVRPVGVTGRFLGRAQRTGDPMPIAAIGALFALSFDTMGQTSLFP